MKRASDFRSFFAPACRISLFASTDRIDFQQAFIVTDQPDSGAGIKRLWPTFLLERIVPGHEQANIALARLIRDLEKKHRGLTTDYRHDNLMVLQHPATEWLTQCVNVTVGDYFAALGMEYEIRWHLHGWANINRFGDYHDFHNHPHAYLSGTYYVQLPTVMEKLETRDDVRPGRITFYDPRGAVNMTAIKGDPNIEPEHTVEPRPGMILLWPAFVNHFVHPNLSKQMRISVSFNVMLNWSDDYLPQQ